MSWPPVTLLIEIMAASPKKTDYGDGWTSEDYYALYCLYMQTGTGKPGFQFLILGLIPLI